MAATMSPPSGVAGFEQSVTQDAMTSLFERMMQDPRALVDGDYNEMMHWSREEIDAYQDKWAQVRFAQLRSKIPILEKLADGQGIQTVETKDDLAPLLFAHTTLKAYPLSWIEKGEFAKLTKWLNGLSAVDISNVDMTGVETIDDWIDRLDQNTDVRVFHSSGTSGKLSFVPRTVADHTLGTINAALFVRDWRGPNSGPDTRQNHIPVIIPTYRFGASASQRGGERNVALLGGGEALYLYPERRLSADVVSLAGRIRAADAKGEQGTIAISPALAGKRDEMLANERNREADMNRFFAEAHERFAGRDVMIGSTWPPLYEWAMAGLARGDVAIFGKGSVLTTGGGTKGNHWPEGWLDRIKQFLGFDNIFHYYSMSEVISRCLECEKGHYHFPPTLIAYLLDPKSGELLGRDERRTGRMAFFDTLITSHWSGLVTGDEVTLSAKEETCGCGRTGDFLEYEIRRYSEKEGGDDKVVCAGAPQAHDDALLLLERLGW
jgi:hypothetical protein